MTLHNRRVLLCWVSFMLSVIMLNVIMLNAIYAECHSCWASFLLSVSKKHFILSVMLLNIFMLSVILLNIVMLSTIMMNIVMLSVILLSVTLLLVIMLNVVMVSTIMMNIVMLSVVAPWGSAENTCQWRNGLAYFAEVSVTELIFYNHRRQGNTGTGCYRLFDHDIEDTRKTRCQCHKTFLHQ
jgi:hypothetical protein